MPVGPSPDPGKINMAEALLEPALSRGQDNDLAVICHEAKITYAALAVATSRSGNVFRDLGVNVGHRVLMMVRDTPEFLYIYIGLLKIGAVPVALNTRLTSQDIAYIIDDSGANILILDSCFQDQLHNGLKIAKNIPTIIYTDAETDKAHSFLTLLAEAKQELKIIRLPLDAPAIWMYSSGTTGKPKGVVHLLKTVLTSTKVMGEILGLGIGDRIYSTSKLFFAFSLAHCVFASLRLGATTILDPRWPDPDIVASNVQRFKPTTMLSVPTFYRSLLRDGVASKPAFKNVKYYLTAGEQMPESLFNQWVEVTGRPALEAIGATETCFLFLSNRPEKFKPGTCGVPTPGTEVKIVDELGKQVSKPGVQGVLWVKMESLASGYWNMEERTKSVFQKDWYCTNDMFSVDEDGFYQHQGRADDMLKISGQWVSPSEIEEQVLHFREVQEAAVVGIPNEEGLIRLALFMVAPEVTGDHKLLETRITERLINHLSIYKCPRQFYYLNSMPQTSTGKLKRFALRESIANK